jgi:hypothetical protein
VTLANYINALPTQPSAEDIHRAFKDYKRERIPWVKEAFDSSAILKTMVEAVSFFFLDWVKPFFL